MARRSSMTTDSSTDAQAYARAMREEGYIAKVVKSKSGRGGMPEAYRGPTWNVYLSESKKKNAGVSLAQLSKGIRVKFVKIRRVKNGIRVTIKK